MCQGFSLYINIWKEKQVKSSHKSKPFYRLTNMAESDQDSSPAQFKGAYFSEVVVNIWGSVLSQENEVGAE